MARPRTLTEALRTLPTKSLGRLLQERDDLADPAPRDLTELAARATTTPSVTRALGRLDAWRGTVVEGLAALPDPAPLEALADLLDSPLPPVATAVDDLRELALVWGDPDQLHLVRPAREAFQPFPGGLAPPSPRPLPEDQIDAALERCGPAARTVLDRLLWAPTGKVRNADRTVTAGGSSPVEALLAAELLRPLDADTVILPREVAWRLRGGRLRPEPVPTTPPPLTGRTRNPLLVDRAAAGAAFGLLDDVELLVESLDRTAARPLRTGGLSTRDVTALARRLDTDAAHTTFVLECAYAARLVALDPSGLTPTSTYEAWLAEPAPYRWRTIAEAWRTAPRFFARSAAVGGHALGPEADFPAATDLRGALLTALTSAEPGTVLDRGAVAATLAWHRPKLATTPIDAATVTAWTWAEAAWLGLVALDAVTSFAGLVAAGPDASWPPDLAELFPTPVDTVVIQADLTAVAPGPLEHRVAGELRLLADQESRGAGGVYRFSPASLRRAYDRGWSTPEVHDWLVRHSATGVPQPLAYLVDDVGRQHGSIRVGPAASVLQVEHAAQAAALLKHPRAGELGLRQVAPTVLVAAVEEPELVALLQEAGHAPVVEDAAGRALRPPARLRVAAPARGVATAIDPAAAEALVAELLEADRRTRGAERPAATPATELTLDRLRSATRRAEAVRVGYVTADGRAVERELAPLDLAAGAVRAVDRASAQVVTIPLARISAVSAVTEP
jgi:XPB/Ssl2-like helicase family protein